MKRDISLTAIVSVLLIFAIVPSFASSFSSFSGQNAPDFHLRDLSNTQHSLSDYQGSVVVLDFFSVECSICQVSAKNVLVPLYNNFSSGDAKVQFLSVETTGASADAINTTYLNSTGITWPILTGGNDLKNLYGTNDASTVYVIDPAGKIVASMAHPLDIEPLKAVIESLFEADTSTTPTPTNLTATALTTASATKDFTISGTLSAGSSGIADTSITLQRSTDNVTFSNEISATTDRSGGYQFSQNESAVGTYSYRTAYDGNATYANAKSNVVTVIVNKLLPEPIPTATDNAQKGSKLVSAGLENYTTPLAQQANISTASQKTLLYAPPLVMQITPSSVLAQATAMSAEASALSQGAATSCVVPTTACLDNITPINLPAQISGTASLPVQSVLEFSLLGLGAPMLLIGVLYLLLRRV
jgi:cytochrome oxidase Cu insertion factor (SCO1/SenC/PrrC family)